MGRYATNWPSRRSVRMPAHDYAEPGDYFITLVVRNRECIFGIPGSRACVEEAWVWLAKQYSYVTLDEYVIMPNHLHGIITLTDVDAGGSQPSPTDKATRKPIGQLVGAFKTASTKWINLLRGTPAGTLWQRNYNERLIRTEVELDRVRGYVLSNPAMWANDPENPNRAATVPSRETV